MLLNSQVQELTDVVIVGYTTSTKKSLVSAVSSVKTEELKEIPAVASSLGEALDALAADFDFLTQGGVFSKEFIEAYIGIRRKEVERLNMIPHPVEFEMYYA